MALDRWLCKWIPWLIGCVIGCIILSTIFQGSLPVKIAAVLGMSLLAVPLGLCLRASVVKSLLKVAGVLYYVLSIIAGEITHLLIYGVAFWTVDSEVNGLRAAVAINFNLWVGVGCLIALALQDAIPLRVFPQHVRVFTIASVATYKSRFHALIPALSQCADQFLTSLPV